jgi:hypothetical protein
MMIVNTTKLPVFKHYNVQSFTNGTGGNYSYIIEEIEDHSTNMTNNATKVSFESIFHVFYSIA